MLHAKRLQRLFIVVLCLLTCFDLSTPCGQDPCRDGCTSSTSCLNILQCPLDPSPQLVCPKLSALSTLSCAGLDYASTCSSEGDARALRSADFVFILEYSCACSEVMLRDVVEKVSVLFQESSKEAYSDVNTRFFIVVYLLEQQRTLYVQEITQTNKLPHFDELVSMLHKTARFDEAGKYMCTDLHSFKYLTVKRALQAVGKVVKGKLSHYNDSGLKLSTRTLADLHVISALGIINPSKLLRIDPSLRTKKSVMLAKREIKQEIYNLIDMIPSGAKVSLHFFFSGNSGIDFVGDPDFTVTYSDCTHFNKALTLRALIRAGEEQADTLQAHLLAKGVEIQTRELEDFSRRSDCLMAINPALWGGFGLHAEFYDKCSLIASQPCGEGFYCSPLHGCVRKEEGESSTKRSLVDDIVDGKAPLTLGLSSSHAELAASRKERTSEQESSRGSIADELSITATGTGIPPEFVTGKPKVLDWDPGKPFVEKLISMKEAIVLKKSVVQTWPALHKWNWSYLADNIGSETLESVKCTNQFLTFDPDHRVPLKLNISLPFIQANMTTREFFVCVQEPRKCSDGFFGHYYFGSLSSSLKSDILPDHFLYYTSDDHVAGRQFVWISSSGMITHTHFDQDYNFFVQLVGQKRFTLWTPSQHELMYVYPRVHPLWHKSRVSFQAPDNQRFQQFRKVKPVQIVLEPGDVLYVPPYTWHFVETLSPSVSLSTWSNDNELYGHMNAIYRHDHKFDLIKDPRGELSVLIVPLVVM